MDVDEPETPSFSMETFKESLNQIEQKIYYQEMNPNLELNFVNQDIFINFLKAIFPDMEHYNSKGIITKLQKYLDDNLKFSTKGQQLIMKRFYQLKLILDTYNFKNKRNLTLTFLRLYQIINWGPSLFKLKLTKKKIIKKVPSHVQTNHEYPKQRLIQKRTQQNNSRLQRRLKRETNKEVHHLDNFLNNLII